MHKTHAEELDDEIRAAAADVHAATARLVDLVADFEAEEVGGDWGFASNAHWLSVAAGFDLHTGRELFRVAVALRSLPALSAAFAAGTLSLDKLRAITLVATAADEHVWLDIAEAASGAQLRRICREFYRVVRPEEAELLEPRRGLHFQQRLDGLVTITARLLPEEAEIVGAALDKLRAELPPDEAQRWAARDADALVEISRRALAGGESEPPMARVVVHVDQDVLASNASGRCKGRFRLSAEAARELSCDAEVQIQSEREDVPIDLGRSRRLVSPQLARALRSRDGGCVFPGCGRQKVHSHHLEHWAHGGSTNLRNLVSLCAFHHHQLHRGFFRIAGKPGRLTFATRDGGLIGRGPMAAGGGQPKATGSPSPPIYTWRMPFQYACAVIADSIEFARAQPP